MVVHSGCWIMTAETLKPFITPTSMDNYVTSAHSSSASASTHHRHHRHRTCYFLAVAASVVAIVLTMSLLGMEIWNTTRITELQTEVETLNRVIKSMQNRLGLTYLDDVNDLEKEANNNKLIDDELPDDNDVDDNNDDDVDKTDNDNDSENDEEEEEEEYDDDDDADYDAYDELREKYKHEYEDEDGDDDDDDNGDGDENNSGGAGDNNDLVDVYTDYKKYQILTSKGSNKNSERKTRSVDNEPNESVEPHDESKEKTTTYLRPLVARSIVARESYEKRRTPLRPYHSRRHKYMPVKRGDSIVSEALMGPRYSDKAIQYHITHKRHHTSHRDVIRVSTPTGRDHSGEVYFGIANWTSNNFIMQNSGVIKVMEPGFYYVYAQICYLNNLPRNGFTIYHNHGIFVECVNTVNGRAPDAIWNTCHTGGLIHLDANDHIHIRDLNPEREIREDRSYFGLIKIDF